MYNCVSWNISNFPQSEAETVLQARHAQSASPPTAPGEEDRVELSGLVTVRGGETESADIT